MLSHSVWNALSLDVLIPRLDPSYNLFAPPLSRIIRLTNTLITFTNHNAIVAISHSVHSMCVCCPSTAG